MDQYGFKIKTAYMSQLGQHTKADYIDWKVAMDRLVDVRKERPVISGIIATGITTGLRISDMLALSASDIKPEMMIVEKKTAKRRCFSMNPWTLNFLDGLGLPSAGFLFSKDGSKPYSVQHVNRELKEVFYDVDTRVSSHSLRKTFGRRVMELNNYSAEALLLLMDAFNHSSPAITKVYLGLRQEEVNKIYLNIV